MCPNRQTLFRENTFAQIRHIKTPFSAATFRRMCPNRQNLFRENTFAQIRHIKSPFSAHFGTQSCILLLEDFCPFLFLDVTRAYMVSCHWCRKSSANYLARVEFSQKSFVDLIFGHTFLVHFLRNFSSLVQIESKYNKINLCNNSKKNESIMVTQKSRWQKVIFGAQKKLKKRHQPVQPS